MAKNVVWTNPVNMLARSVVSVPEGVGTQGLPVLYLFHGIGDTPAIWWSASGQVPILLAAAQAPPMVVVMLGNGTIPPGRVPALATVMRHFDEVRTAVNATYQPDQERQGLLGISMGAQQALAIVLASLDISVLGLLSGMFQGNHLALVACTH